jgi:tryptophanyl-tRNA synthetase
MSKSAAGDNHSIGVLDYPDVIRRKVMHATTDSLRDIRFDPARSGVYNLLSIYEGFTGLARETIESRFSSKGYADLKREVAEAIIESLRPLRARYQEIVADETALDRILSAGANAVRPIAEKTLHEAMRAIGLR